MQLKLLCSELNLEKVHQLRTQSKPQELENALVFLDSWLKNKHEFTFYTSGSTGPAKPIRIARRKMELSARATLDFCHLTPGQTALLCLDAKYIAGAMVMVRAVLAGLNLILVSPSRNPLLDLGEAFEFASMVPLQLSSIMEHEDSLRRLQSAKVILLGGAPADSSLVEKCQKLIPSVHATYGMTETVSHVAIRTLNGTSATPYFQAVGGHTFSMDDRQTLSITGPMTDGDQLQTHDLIELISDQRFRWLGRVDNVINSGAFKISPEKVEEELTKCKGLRGSNFFVCGLKDDEFGQAVTLIIESNTTTQPEDLIREIKRYTNLASHEVPKRIVRLPNFLYTPTGKVNRNATLKANHI